MKPVVAIGIDIGKKGAIVITNDKGIVVHKMPMIKDELDYHALYKILKVYVDLGHIVFEKLGVIFGSSKGTAFSMGHQAGAVEMACIALNLPFTKVNAKDWQKEMFQGVDKIYKPLKKDQKNPSIDTKAMALVAAKRLFPNQPLTFGEKATVPHDGLVDALLMSEYCRRHFL